MYILHGTTPTLTSLCKSNAQMTQLKPATLASLTHQMLVDLVTIEAFGLKGIFTRKIIPAYILLHLFHINLFGKKEKIFFFFFFL